MSNQDLINYQNSIAAQNTALIAQLTQSNINLNQNITQIQMQITNNNTQIAVFEKDNAYITETITFIPSSYPDIIAYQNNITTSNTDAIARLNQSNINLNQNITQIQMQITNNNTQISTLKTKNTYIAETIAFIPNS